MRPISSVSLVVVPPRRAASVAPPPCGRWPTRPTRREQRMDPTRFDALTKRWATRGASRRGLLRGLGGGLLAALGGAGAAGADPACREEGHPCEGDQQCCAGLVCAAGE